MGARGRHGTGLRRVLALLAAVVALAAAVPVAQASAQAPTVGQAAIRGQAIAAVANQRAADYWTETFSNPLDFDDDQDLILANEGPMQGLGNYSIANGQFSFMMDSGSPGGYFSPIWGGYPGAADHGREGSYRFVDTSRWRYLVLRIHSSNNISAGVRWYTCESGVADSCQGGFPFEILEGTQTYAFDLQNPPSNGGNPALAAPWSGKVTGLRIAIAGEQPASIGVDWIRLFATPEANGNMHVNGSRVGPIPEVLNPDRAGAIPVVYNADGSVATQVNPNPCADYAIAFRNGNSWDFNATSDVQQVFNVLPGWKVQNGWFEGKSVASPTKPGDAGVRVPTPAVIDPNRFKVATAVIPKTEGSYSQKFAEGGGWVIRWLWKHVSNPNQWQISRQLAQYPNERVMSIDLADPNPYDGVAPKPADVVDTEHKGGTGWNVPGQQVNLFRYDPHEDYASRSFWIDQLWLAQEDCSGSPFNILFRDNNWAPGTTVDIWADSDPLGYNGQMVASGVPVTQGINTFSWSAQTSGKYWVWIVMHRAGSSGRAYATGPVNMTADPCAPAGSSLNSDIAISLPRCSFTLTKTVSPPAPPAGFDVGDTITYQLVMTNTGQVPLTQATISDPKLGALSCNPAQPAALAPKAKLTCTGKHVVSLADYQGNATTYANTATGKVKELKQPATASATVRLAPPAALSLSKQVTTPVPATGFRPGQSIAYKLVATNTGKRTLTQVSLSDPALAGLSCQPAIPVASLAVNASVTCTGQHLVNQGDVDAPGSTFVNTATATATPLKQPVKASASAKLDDRTSMAVEKKVTSPKGLGPYTVDETITYAIVVTNTGSASIRNVSVSDPKVQNLVCGLALPVPALPSNGTLTCTAQHKVTAADAAAGATYTNTATATATGLKPVTDSATVRLMLPPPVVTVTTPTTVPPTTSTTTTVPTTTTTSTTTTVPTTTTAATTTTRPTTTRPTTTRPSTTRPPATAATIPTTARPGDTTVPGTPQLRLTPEVGPTGFVTRAIGTGFPADTLIALRWDGGHGGVTVRSDANGSFSVPVLIFPHDTLGPRFLVWADRPQVKAPFLVVASPLQPGGNDPALPRRIRYGR